MKIDKIHYSVVSGGYNRRVINDTGEYVARVKGDALARQFAASGRMLAQLKSNEITLRKIAEMDGVLPAWQRLAEHEANWIRQLVAGVEGER